MESLIYKSRKQELELFLIGGRRTDGYYYIDGIKRCWKIWNFYNFDDKITIGDGYAIHHKDGNKANDNLDNLEKMTRGEHTILHMSGSNHPNYGKPRSEETSKKISIANLGKNHWNYGGAMSVGHRNIISMSNTGIGNPNCKTTEESVWEYLEAYYNNEMRVIEIVKRFNTTYNIVYSIVKGTTFNSIYEQFMSK